MKFNQAFRVYFSKLPLDIRNFIKFGVVGGTAAIIHFSLLYSLTEWAEVWYPLSNAVGFIISALFNFTTNKLWTFKRNERGMQAAKQLLKFSIVLLTGLLFVTALIVGLTEKANFDYRISWLFATGLITFWNFFMHKYWTFKKS